MTAGTARLYTASSVSSTPKSKSFIRLTSRDPTAPLNIDLSYLSNQSESGPLRAALRLTLRIRDSAFSQMGSTDGRRR